MGGPAKAASTPGAVVIGEGVKVVTSSPAAEAKSAQAAASADDAPE